MAVGTDNIDLAAAARLGIAVSNTPDVLTDATADLAFALLLAAARRLAWADRYVRGGGFVGWNPELGIGLDVTGRTLGIVGAGRIGRAVAERARGFRMEVLFHSRSGGTPLGELLERSDFVSLHVPLTAETRHLIGAPELARMKPSAVLVNTARGPIVDEAALVRALRDGTDRRRRPRRVRARARARARSARPAERRARAARRQRHDRDPRAHGRGGGAQHRRRAARRADPEPRALETLRDRAAACEAVRVSRDRASDLPRTLLQVLCIGGLIAGGFWVLSPFLGALAWATMMVVATWPVLLRVQGVLWGRRGLAVAVMTIALLLVLIVPLYIGTVRIVENVDKIGVLTTWVVDLASSPPPDWVDSIPLVGTRATSTWRELAASGPEAISDRLAPYARQISAWLLAEAGSLGSMLVQFLLTVGIAAVLYSQGEAAVALLRRFATRVGGRAR